MRAAPGIMVAGDHPRWRDAVARDLTETGSEVVAVAGGEFRRLAASPTPGTPRLTEREAEIPRMAGTGLSCGQVAGRLVICRRTVQNHVQHTLSKLHLHNRVELVRYAIEHGLDSGARVGQAAREDR